MIWGALSFNNDNTDIYFDLTFPFKKLKENPIKTNCHKKANDFQKFPKMGRDFFCHPLPHLGQDSQTLIKTYFKKSQKRHYQAKIVKQPPGSNKFRISRFPKMG